MDKVVKEYKYCKLCKRPLKTSKSRILGMGETCYRKYLSKNKKLLFSLQKSNTKL